MTLILSGMIFSRFCLAIVTGVEKKKKEKFSFMYPRIPAAAPALNHRDFCPGTSVRKSWFRPL
jgi:hypothetical protein